jgi:polysaccharide biosynthesis protein PelA
MKKTAKSFPAVLQTAIFKYLKPRALPWGLFKDIAARPSIYFYFLFLFLCFVPCFSLQAEPVKRRILAFWDSKTDIIVEDSPIHRILEMPLNYLGLDVIYHDIQKPLPTLSQQDEIRGILICFIFSAKMQDPEKFIDWLLTAVDLGKKVVLMKNMGFSTNLKGEYTPLDLQNRLFEKLGFTNTEEWVDYPYDYQVLTASPELLPFELNIPKPVPAFYRTRVIDKAAQSYLKVGIPGKPESEADVVIIGPQGAYVSNEYDNLYDYSLGTRALGWYINPFEFFTKAFDIAGLPVPDTTTLAGRRIFFSTIHGDDWNSETLIEEYHGKEIFSSEVILERVIKPNPDIPVAVALVAADFDPEWVAKKKSPETARGYFNLPQVEAASHTYSHPFYWDFFRTGASEKEREFLPFYPKGAWERSYLSWFRAKMYQIYSPKAFAKRLKWGYALPRAYANEKFNVNKEISGSIDYLNQFAPPKNKIKLLIWSGDSRPWDIPVELCVKAGVNNFGGGNVRFDAEYPSVLFVSSLARKPGGIIQLYAAANAENSYTNSWKDTFYGFQYLPETLKNTNSPRRLKPLLLYYHAFSGEFAASLNAVLSNLAFIRTQSPIAIRVARYCDIGSGFFTAKIEPLGENAWKIQDRQGLQTFRFDKAKDSSIDLSASKGVIGYRDHEDSLFVYLDASVDQPEIVLSKIKNENISFLIDSNWEIWDLQRTADGVDFKTSGWGKLSMRWKMPRSGTYAATTSSKSEANFETSPEGILEISLDLPYNTQTQLGLKLR